MDQKHSSHLGFNDLDCDDRNMLVEDFDNYHPDLSVTVDVVTGEVLQCNKGLINILGYSKEEIVGQPIFSLYHQECINDAKQLFDAISMVSEIHDAKQTLRTKDGSSISVCLDATVVLNKHGEQSTVRCVWNDVSLRELETGRIHSENRRSPERQHFVDLKHPNVFVDIITQDMSMYRLFQKIESVATTNNPVLVTGETGVGKEKIGEIIHKLSGRTGNFVTVNIGAVDAGVFSDTLFGHKKGAFTGAQSDRLGSIARASNGTLLLDEMGDLSLESQIKLLRFLQEGTYSALGNDDIIQADVRIVAMTNHSTESLREGGQFRDDLYYRLETHHLHLPPLRERMGDIRPLLLHFLKQASNEQGKNPPTPPQTLFTLLSSYHFPGNIRELENMVRDAISLHDGGVLSSAAFREKIDEGVTTSVGDAIVQADEATFSDQLSLLHKLPQLKELEEQLILEALKRSDGNQTIAAGLLGMKKQTLNNRLRRARESTE